MISCDRWRRDFWPARMLATMSEDVIAQCGDSSPLARTTLALANHQSGAVVG
jgi:hypothetical protein